MCKHLFFFILVTALCVSCNNIDTLNEEIESQYLKGEHDSRLNGWWANSSEQMSDYLDACDSKYYIFFDEMSFDKIDYYPNDKTLFYKWYSENDCILHIIIEEEPKYFYSRKGYTGILHEFYSRRYKISENGDSLFYFNEQTCKYYLGGIKSKIPEMFELNE